MSDFLDPTAIADDNETAFASTTRQGALARAYLALKELAGPDYHVFVSAGGWAIEHPLRCRRGGGLTECPVHQAAMGLPNPPEDGRWKIELTASEELKFSPLRNEGTTA